MHFIKQISGMCRGLIVASLTLISASHADTLTTPFNIALTAPTALMMIGGVSHLSVPLGTLAADLPNQRLTEPFTVDIAGIHMKLDYAFQTPTVGAKPQEWKIQSTSLGAALTIDSITASKVIVQGTGGSSIVIRINGSCKDIHLTLAPGTAQVNAAIGVELQGDHANYRLNQFAVDWTTSSWKIDSMNCDGLQGFGDEVRQNLIQQFQTAAPFLPAIQAQIQTTLLAFSGQTIVWSMQAPDHSGVTLTLQPTSLRFLPDGTVATQGLAKVTFPKLSQTACQSDIQIAPETAVTPDTLTIPVAALLGLIKCAYLNDSLTARFTSQEFPAFQSLLGNPFLKLLVWPHLYRFSTGNIFKFEMSLGKEPVFGPIQASQDGAIQFDFSAETTLSIFAPKQVGYVHYIDFVTTVKGPAQLSLQDGTLYFSEQADTFSLERRDDQAYIEAYNPAQRIATSTFAGYLWNYLASPGLSYTLPAFEIPDAFSLKFNSARMDSSNIVVSIAALPTQN